jgi:hypothetical protein
MTMLDTLLFIQFNRKLEFSQVAGIIDAINSILYAWTQIQERGDFPLGAVEVLGFLPLGDCIHTPLDFYDPKTKIMWLKVPADHEQVYVIRFMGVHINYIKKFHASIREHIITKIVENPWYSNITYGLYQELEA